MTENYNQERKKHDMIKLNTNEIIDRLGRTTCELNAVN